jgi:hypothetical protein
MIAPVALKLLQQSNRKPTPPPMPAQTPTGMLNHSKILNELAQRYEKSSGRSAGQARRDFIVDLEDLLYWAGCADGDQRVEAVDHLQQAEEHGALQLDRHPRDPRLIQVVRIKRGAESGFYQFLGLTPPSFRREELARQFQEASTWSLPETYQSGWQKMCQSRHESALNSASIESFPREEAHSNRELLDLTARLLRWKGDSLVRFVSSVLCGDSQKLPALRYKIEALLAEITDQKICSLKDLGIVDSPSTALLHGPLHLCLHGKWVDLEPLFRPIRLSEIDLLHAEQLEAALSARGLDCDIRRASPLEAEAAERLLSTGRIIDRIVDERGE